MPASGYGDLVSMRCLYADGSVQGVFPMRTVCDDGSTYVGYLPAQTEIMYWSFEDGSDPRAVPLAKRFARKLTTAPSIWRGGGVLRVIPRGEPFQVLHFWREGEFSGWYVNLESTKSERGGFLDAVDWHLDLWLGADRTPLWKDVEEAETALAAGHLTRAQLDQAWSTGRAIVDDVSSWPARIGDWTSYTPPEDWGPLSLPADWRL